MDVCLVVAVAENGGIGKNNALLWRLPNELKHFRALTLHKPVVMGRRTFESIGHPLPQRLNIVVSRDPRWQAAGVLPAPSWPAARALAIAQAPEASELMVIGGAELFAAALLEARRIYLTRVLARVAADTFFPAPAADTWREVARTGPVQGPGDEYAYCFLVYERAQPG